MIHPIVGVDGTICLFRFNDEVILSFVGYGVRCILSDWYLMDDNTGQLIERLNIANVSIRSGCDYFSDMVYTLARQYYLTTQPMVYDLLPIDFITNAEFDKVDKEELDDFIAYEIATPKREYGDDYVEYDEFLRPQPVDIFADLDLMLLELDGGDDNPFDEGIDNTEKADEISEHDGCFDKYEFDDVNPEIFRDPTLMVKWLKEMENNSF